MDAHLLNRAFALTISIEVLLGFETRKYGFKESDWNYLSENSGICRHMWHMGKPARNTHLISEFLYRESCKSVEVRGNPHTLDNWFGTLDASNGNQNSPNVTLTFLDVDSDSSVNNCSQYEMLKRQTKLTLSHNGHVCFLPSIWLQATGRQKALRSRRASALRPNGRIQIFVLKGFSHWWRSLAALLTKRSFR